MSATFCVLRLLGDFSLMISSPLLIWRIVSSKDGCDGVSLTTQIFHLVMFLARYIDIFLPGPSSSWLQSTMLKWYNPIVKAYLITVSAWVLVAMAYRMTADRVSAAKAGNPVPTSGHHGCGKKLFRSVALYILPALVLGYHINYLYDPQRHTKFLFSPSLFLTEMRRQEWIEFLWAFSHWLAAAAEIPQYQKYYRYLGGRLEHDLVLLASLGAMAAFREFYFLHWIHRYIEQGVVDPVAILPAIVQVIVFWIFYAFCRNKLRNNAKSILADEEHTVGAEKPEVLFVVDLKE